MNVEITNEVTEDIANILYSAYVDSITLLDSKTIYKLYKQGLLTKLGVYRSHINVLEVLCSLGFSPDHPGTYFFKDLILKIMDTLSTNKKMRDQLKEELANPFSAFYFDLARNELDIGVKSFHEFVGEAYATRDGNNADPEVLSLFEDIYGESTIDEFALSVCDFIKVGMQKAALGL